MWARLSRIAVRASPYCACISCSACMIAAYFQQGAALQMESMGGFLELQTLMDTGSIVQKC